MKDIMNLAHIGMNVPDIEAAERFYTELLGFEKVFSYRYDGQIPVSFVQNGTCMIEFVEDPAAAKTDGVINHIALAVEDIESVKSRLQSAGIEFEADEITNCPDCFPNGTKWILFRGVCGERLELTQVL